MYNSELHAAVEAFDGVVADDFELVGCWCAEWEQGGMFVHGFEAQVHAGAYRSTEVTVVVGEDVVGDACPDVDDEAVLVWFFGVGGGDKGDAVGSYLVFVFVSQCERKIRVA